LLDRFGFSFFNYFAYLLAYFLYSGTASELTFEMISEPEVIKLLKLYSRKSNLSKYLAVQTSIPSSP
jgi:hypothetical protein